MKHCSPTVATYEENHISHSSPVDYIRFSGHTCIQTVSSVSCNFSIHIVSVAIFILLALYSLFIQYCAFQIVFQTHISFTMLEFGYKHDLNFIGKSEHPKIT